MTAICGCTPKRWTAWTRACSPGEACSWFALRRTGRATCPTMRRTCTNPCGARARTSPACSTASSRSATVPTPRPSATAAGASMRSSLSWERAVSATSCSTTRARGRCRRNWRWPGRPTGFCDVARKPSSRRDSGSGGIRTVPSFSNADHSASPPKIDVPRDYNAAHDLIERNLRAGRAHKVAFIDDAGEYTFGELAKRVNRFGSGLKTMGLGMEDRVLLVLADTIDFPTAFLGAIKAGIIPVSVNTLLTPHDYEHMLGDSRARALIVSEHLLPH